MSVWRTVSHVVSRSSSGMPNSAPRAACPKDHPKPVDLLPMPRPSTRLLLRHWSSRSPERSRTEATREPTCLRSSPVFGAPWGSSLAAYARDGEIPSVTTLDPLIRLLVRSLTVHQPARLHEPISINELMDKVLPYRLVRRELGVDTSEDYETLIFRLCAGEGGFVQGDPATQAALQAEAAKALPDLALLRVYGATHVVLRTDLLIVTRDVRPEERYAPPGQQVPTAAEEPAAVEDDADEEEVPGVGEPEADTEEAWLPDPVFEANASVSAERQPETAPAPAARPSDPEKLQVRCPFCGGLLPARMMINFCPHCGMGQDVGTCRHCGADMDVGWRYCVSCGEEAQGGVA